MKKTFLLLGILIFTISCTSQYYLKITKEYKKLFSKRNISNIDQNLTDKGWTKLEQATLFNLLNGESSVDYDIWINEELKEKIYIFRSNGNPDKANQQFSYMYHNLCTDDNPINYSRSSRYYLMAQSQSHYNTLMLVFRN